MDEADVLDRTRRATEASAQRLRSTGEHALAQQGHCMLLALDSNGVPSVAEWVYLD